MNNLEKRLKRIEEYLGISDDAPSLENSVINFSIKPALADVKITRSTGHEVTPAGKSSFPIDETAFCLIVGKPRRRKGKYKPGETLFRSAGESLKDFMERVRKTFNNIYKH